MLIALYHLIFKVFFPSLLIYAYALLHLVFILAGVLILFQVLGISISHNLGSTIANAAFRAIGYVCHILIQSLGWIIRNTFRILPYIFSGSRRIFKRHGLNDWVCNLLATLVTLVTLVIII